MGYIDPETAAHDIARIFCEHKFEEIYANAKEEWKRNPKGNVEILAAKIMFEKYADIYDHIFATALSDNHSSFEDELAAVPGVPET